MLLAKLVVLSLPLSYCQQKVGGLAWSAGKECYGLLRMYGLAGRLVAFWLTSRPYQILQCAVLVPSLAVLVVASVPKVLSAQQTVVVGTGLPFIEVDLSVLESSAKTASSRLQRRLMSGRSNFHPDTQLLLTTSSNTSIPRTKPLTALDPFSISHIVQLTPPTFEVRTDTNVEPNVQLRAETITVAAKIQEPYVEAPNELELPRDRNDLQIESTNQKVEDNVSLTSLETTEQPLTVHSQSETKANTNAISDDPDGNDPETELHTSLPAETRIPIVEGQILRLEFRQDSARVRPQDHDNLRLVADAISESDGHLLLQAYASVSTTTTSNARRLSLKRALSVRSLLIENGVRSTRINVRALGNANDHNSADRVDILYVDR